MKAYIPLRRILEQRFPNLDDEIPSTTRQHSLSLIPSPPIPRTQKVDRVHAPPMSLKPLHSDSRIRRPGPTDGRSFRQVVEEDNGI